MLNDVVTGVLDQIADGHEFPEDAAVNIRVDGAKAQRHSTKNIEIVTKTDKDGIDVYIAPNTVHG
ncbi:MAG: ABC transporter permease, partial [Oscillospiraceae bacterium]|nr:ABC transporter permease [Oscillospiraceae bacterium]